MTTGNGTSSLHHDACLTSGQCLNGGVCAPADNDTTTYRHCHCRDGFSGFRCETYCPLSCRNGGVCQRRGGGSSDRIEDYLHDGPGGGDQFVCKCKGRFTGNLCQTSYRNCAGVKCLNDATCASPLDRAVGPFCDCADGYAGNFCQTRVAVSAQERKSVGTGVGLPLLILAVALVLLVVWRRRRRKPLDRISIDCEERQNLHTSLPREERDDWECRNII